MRVLVACEFSGRVRDAFLARGHDAWSCDMVRTSHPRHLQKDAEMCMEEAWDLIIAHPPCTYLANSSVHLLKSDPTRRFDLATAAMFFRKCLTANAPRVAVENPVPHKYAIQMIGTPYSQIVHPWQFGHTEKKPTCLWLKGLPNLTPTCIVKPRASPNPYTPKSSALGRGRLRSITFYGIAEAMASQWGDLDADSSEA